MRAQARQLSLRQSGADDTVPFQADFNKRGQLVVSAAVTA